MIATSSWAKPSYDEAEPTHLTGARSPGDVTDSKRETEQE